MSFWLCMRDDVVLKVRRQAQHLRLKQYATFREPPFALLLSQPRLGWSWFFIILYFSKKKMPKGSTFNLLKFYGNHVTSLRIEGAVFKIILYDFLNDFRTFKLQRICSNSLKLLRWFFSVSSESRPTEPTKKVRALRLLALKVASHLHWNLMMMEKG